MRILVVLSVLFNLLFGVDATLEVNKGVEQISKIVVEDDSTPSEFSKNFSKVLAVDLKVLALFNVDDNYYSGQFDVINRYDSAKYQLKFKLQPDSSGGIKAEVKMIDGDRALFNKSYYLKNSEMAVFLAHNIAYDINEKLGGTNVSWMKNKVVFTRLVAPRKAEIVVADYTLSYQQVVLKGGMYNFAKWANGSQNEIYYTSLNDYVPTIYKLNLATGSKAKIISSDGMAVCSDVSEDGTKLLLTLAPNGQPDIYVYDITNSSKTRVTDFSGIDVNGQFMGDGSIAFVSNRLGNANIFSTRVGSSAVSRLVHYGKNNSSLSSYKNLLVYKARESDGSFRGNNFNLHLLSLNSGNVKRLTASGENDFPKFSHDGEAILFIKQEGSRSSVGIIRHVIGQSFSFSLKAGRISSIDW